MATQSYLHIQPNGNTIEDHGLTCAAIVCNFINDFAIDSADFTEMVYLHNKNTGQCAAVGFVGAEILLSLCQLHYHFVIHILEGAAAVGVFQQIAIPTDGDNGFVVVQLNLGSNAVFVVNGEVQL